MIVCLRMISFVSVLPSNDQVTLPPDFFILSACITDVPELPVSNLPTIRPNGCICTTS